MLNLSSGIMVYRGNPYLNMMGTTFDGFSVNDENSIWNLRLVLLTTVTHLASEGGAF